MRSMNVIGESLSNLYLLFRKWKTIKCGVVSRIPTTYKSYNSCGLMVCFNCLIGYYVEQPKKRRGNGYVLQQKRVSTGPNFALVPPGPPFWTQSGQQRRQELV